MLVRFLLIAAAVFIATGIDSGEAVKCYVCNTGELYHGSRCDSDSLDKTLLLDCEVEGVNDNKNYTMCRKYIQDVEGDYRVVRSCATDGRPKDGCIARTGTSNIKLWYCECLGDECNASPPSPTAGIYSLLLLLITALPFAYLA